MADCDHDFQFEGEEVFTQFDNIIRLTRLVRWVKCRQEGMDVYNYIGTNPKDEKLCIKEDEKGIKNV